MVRMTLSTLNLEMIKRVSNLTYRPFLKIERRNMFDSDYEEQKEKDREADERDADGQRRADQEEFERTHS